LAKVIVQLNNRENEVQDAERFDGAAKSPTDETALAKFSGANNRRAVLWVFVVEVPDANRRLLSGRASMSAPLKMTGMSIERGNRRCLVAKPRRLPAG